MNDLLLTTPAWEDRLAKSLPRLGHRNWIVIADAAYPLQTAPGVETLSTGADHLEVLSAILAQVAAAPHVRPLIHLDAELEALSEGDAPGINRLRTEMKALLAKEGATSLPHDALIARLDEAGQRFHILLLKTTLTLPYTSVFIELDCGYWNAAAEARLRATLSKS